MFKEKFVQLCIKKGVAPTTACVDIGLARSTFTTWSETSVPRRATLQKFADYFGCTVDDLIGPDNTVEEKEKTPEEPKLSEGEAMLLEAIRDVPEDQRPALLMELMRIALKNQK